MSWASLSLCLRMVVRAFLAMVGFSRMSSSMRFSRYPLMMASGVRSSCEALATNSLLTWSVRCSEVTFLMMILWSGVLQSTGSGE